MSKPQNRDQAPYFTEFSLLLTGVFLVGLYVLLRYRTLWGETDTHVFTTVIRAMLDASELLQAGDVYPNGYGYQTLAVFLVQVMGIELSTFQLVGGPLLIVWVVFPAWLLYREFTGTSRGAVLSTVLLFIQPEFLFPLLRGTHEKFTRGLMLLAVYLLIRSLHSRSHLARFTSWLLAFYLTAYATITFNNLLASSFIVALSLSLILNWVVMNLSHVSMPTAKKAIQRLMYATVISLILTLIFTFYLYQPAKHDLLILQTIGERTAALALDVEANSSNPYQVINTGWISLRVYLMLSLANWLLLGMSALIWLWQSLTWLWQRQQPPGKNDSEVLLWAFYGAFALIGALSVISDLSGAIGSNLQHRLFPSFVMFAAPVVGKWLIDRAKNSRVAQIILCSCIGLLTVLSTFKATNEPLFSNKWLFYVPAEMQALDWAKENLTENQRIWVEFDERLSTALSIRTGARKRELRLDQYIVELGTHDFLISDVTRRRSIRLSLPLPIEADSLRTYDNGQAQIYHLRPRTEYQQ
jgi:hypothetical protein